jgi:hypothetical protein
MHRLTVDGRDVMGHASTNSRSYVSLDRQDESSHYVGSRSGKVLSAGLRQLRDELGNDIGAPEEQPVSRWAVLVSHGKFSVISKESGDGFSIVTVNGQGVGMNQFLQVEPIRQVLQAGIHHAREYRPT